MRTKIFLAFLTQICLFSALFAQENDGWKQFLLRENPNYYEICTDVERYFEQNKDQGIPEETGEPGADEGSAYNQFMAWKWFWSTRVNADGSFPDVRQTGRLRPGPGAAGGAQNRGSGNDCGWELISQTTCSGGYSGMGRTNSVAFHPTDPNIYYVCGQSGGVWKTTDGGQSYSAISEGLPYNSAANLVVDYNNPDILYLSNGNYSSFFIYNTGIYKSTDGGVNWEPTGLSWSLTQSVTVSRMVMNPQDPSVLLVAASNGLWRSTNGGDTWAMVRAGNYTDVAYRPGDPNTVYAAFYNSGSGSEIYRSVNGGDTWSKLSNFAFGNNRIRISVSPANPDLLTALCRYGDNRAFYFSGDGGATFTYRSECPESDVLLVSPANPTVIYCGGVNIHRSDDQGATWTKISHWHGGQPEPTVHADQRSVNWQPGTNHIFFCNDGGVWRYEEVPQVFTELSNGLIITQFYHIAVAQTDETFMIGGTQDNGGRKRVGPGEWEPTNGGDAMEVAIDYTDANILYTTYVSGQLYRSMDGWNNDTYYRISDNLPGQTPEHDLTGSWVAPYQIDPVNPATLVLGYAEVYRTTNRGASWTKISNNLTGSPDAKLDALAIAPSNPNIIYASDNNKIYKTSNLGTNWNSFFPPGSTAITSITVHPNDPSIVYITRGGFSAGAKVFRSDDGGSTWTNISGSLPNVATNCLYLDVANDGSFTLFTGNDLGVWYRKSTMSDWVGMNQNLPVTVVSDLELQRASRKLRAGTYGRGIWEYDLNHLPAKNFAICSDENRAQICLPQTYSFTVSANAWQDAGTPLALSVAGLPAGASADLSAAELLPGDIATITVDFPAGLAEGEFPLTVLATAGGDTATVTIRLTLVSNDFAALKPILPADGTSGVTRWPLLRWSSVPDADSYEIELATSPGFEPANLVKSYSNLKVDSLQWNLALEESRTYYWRIRPVNPCGPGAWTEPFVFATVTKTCASLDANDLPKPITANGTPTVESKITVNTSGPISQLKIKNFEGNHDFFKDLEAYIVGPSGTQVLLFKGKCGSYSGGFKLGFDDDAPLAFGCPPPQNSNAYRPEGLLNAFKGQDAAGVWTLRVKDNVISSGGQLSGFSLEFCSDVAINPPLIVRNETLQLAPGNNAVIDTNLLRTEDTDTPPASLLYTLMTAPRYGELQRSWTGAMQPGDQFTQADIDNGNIRYFDYGVVNTGDSFRFSVTDGDGGLAAGAFRIQQFPLGAETPGVALPFTLAPNPATETLQVWTDPLPSDARIQLFSLSGKLLRSWTLPAGQTSLSLAIGDLPRAMYVVTLQSGKGVGVKRVSKM